MSVEELKDILIVEPFNGGSHGQLIRLLQADPEFGPRCDVYSLPAKKWHWRARTSALYFSQIIPRRNCGLGLEYKVLFTSSVLNLAELVALRPDLAALKKIVYFHENQLVYPVRKTQDRDFQYGYNQILTSMVADVVVFNSKFNMESFLSSISSHLKLIPDHRPKHLEAQIRPKCQVLYFPLVLQKEQSEDCELSCDCSTTNTFQHENPVKDINSDISRASTRSHNIPHNTVDRFQNIDGAGCSRFNSENCVTSSQHSRSISHCDSGDEKQCVGASSQKNDSMYLKFDRTKIMSGESRLHIVWPHRWEHDKDPESFFKAIFQLHSEGLNFLISVIGETFTDVPEIFHAAKSELAGRIVAWGYQSRQDYLSILDSAHVVVSTALHEFFGVSVLEAVSRDCFPLCPRRLVYPEIYPDECLYSTQTQLVKRLRRFCQRPDLVTMDKIKDLPEHFSWTHLRNGYRQLLCDHQAEISITDLQ